MSQAAPATAPEKKGKGRLIIIIAAVVVLLAGGGAAFWFLGNPSAKAQAHDPAAVEDEAEEEAPEPEKGEKQGIVPFDPFVVNLADEGVSRFLRLTLKLVVKNEEIAKELEEDEVVRAQVRSSVLELLTLQTSEHLVTPEGKAELKKQIAERAEHAMHKTKVKDVLFSEFVVQF
jgi:flagellar FliL protein